MTATLARHGAAKRHRAARCSGCCKIKPEHQPNQVSSVFLVRLTFQRSLLERVRSACKRSRPPKTTRARGSHEGALRPHIWPTNGFNQKGLPDGSAARRPRGVQTAAERRGPRTRRERVSGLPTAAQSCRPSCAVLTDATRCAAPWPRLQDGGLHGGGRRAPALGQ